MDALGHGTANFGLQSKNFVVSPCYLKLVTRALADVSLMEGRSARVLYQASRAVFKSSVCVSLHNFLTLSSAALAVPDVDLDLLEYATSPESVQSLAPENWQSIFDICREQNSHFIVSRGSTFYCSLCDTVISFRHLASPRCRKNRENLIKSGGSSPSGLYDAILTAAAELPSILEM